MGPGGLNTAAGWGVDEPMFRKLSLAQQHKRTHKGWQLRGDGQETEGEQGKTQEDARKRGVVWPYTDSLGEKVKAGNVLFLELTGVFEDGISFLLVALQH